MKKEKIIYWISTGILGLFILPGIFFINSSFALEGMQHLGIPSWLGLEVGIASFVAGLVLVIPFFKGWVKEQAYTGLGIVYLSAFFGHLSVDGLVPTTLQALVMFGILLLSYVYYHKVKNS
ncbi:MAG: DoxX family protein [Candidatus Zambryskibacteria bacterium]|nr:DoxX family protein [Candidatus Zambryskibacteria bacterium]